MLKVGIYIFGIDFLAETGASDWLIWLAAYSIIAASVVAMTKDNLKARLAYSTISQLSYITLGVALATSMGVMGGGLHMVTHAMGKITLFMCAGSIYVVTHKTEISQMTGLGRRMPVTFIAFLIGSLSIIGLPPFAGSWSKWLLILASADTGELIIIGVLLISSLLNVAYLMPLVAKGFFMTDSGKKDLITFGEGPLLLWIPLALTAFGCIVLFFYAGTIQDFLMPLIATP
jgi:multicomponent Na+:H+ antiporter subunit D